MARGIKKEPLMQPLTHFIRSEFVCPCCKTEFMDWEFLSMIDSAREDACVPFKITSGYRCTKHQQELREQGYETAHNTSPHELGVACDIYVPSTKNRFLILDSLMYVGFNRFGLGSNFIHVDRDLSRNGARIWVYKR